MGWMGKALLAAAWLAAGAMPALSRAVPAPDFGVERAAEDVRQLAQAVLAADDHGGRAFAIVDKKRARMYLFDGAGRLHGASAVLLGQAFGDQSAPGVGERAQAGDVPPAERTTPAGRFTSQPGRNSAGEHLVWVDYEAAFAIHRLRPGASQPAREARLASPVAADHRVSWGCVVVPVKFYLEVVAKLLGHSRGVVYVMPEEGSPGALLAQSAQPRSHRLRLTATSVIP